MSDIQKHDKPFDGLIYVRDPLINNVLQLVIKDQVGSSGTEQIITISALKAARLGALMTEMAITIFERQNKFFDKE
jgi:hypothetical protein